MLGTVELKRLHCGRWHDIRWNGRRCVAHIQQTSSLMLDAPNGDRRGGLKLIKVFCKLVISGGTLTKLGNINMQTTHIT